MLTTSTDVILASAAIAALAVVVWKLVAHRRRNHSAERIRMGRSAQAWTELQQRCMALVEQDERGGADAEELYRAVARYHAVLVDPTGEHQADVQAVNPKQVPLLQ